MLTIMTDDSNQPAAKGDITALEQRTDTKLDNFQDKITQTFVITLETVGDEIIRGFGIAEENVRFSDHENRMRRFESHVEIDER